MLKPIDWNVIQETEIKERLIKKFLLGSFNYMSNDISYVILTNISAIFDSLISVFTKSHKIIYPQVAVWKTAIITSKFHKTLTPKILILKAKTGSAIIDNLRLVKLLNPSKIMFIGLAARINPSLTLSKAYKITHLCPSKMNKGSQGYNITSVWGMFENRETYANIKRQNIDVVDMESCFFRNFLLSYKKTPPQLEYIVIISDDPFVFHISNTPVDLKQLVQANIDTLKRHVKSFIGVVGKSI